MKATTTELTTDGAVFPTTYGWCGVIWGDGHIVRLHIALPSGTAAAEALAGCRQRPAGEAPAAVVTRLRDYFGGRRVDFAGVPVRPAGTPFQRHVWAAVRRIPRGEVRSYGMIAAGLGNAGLARAVGGAVARNPIPIIIPCHRVVGSSGRLGGFSATGGPYLKARLLALEGVAMATLKRTGRCA